MEEYDVTVIGGGPAGVSAALYMCRGGLSVCIIDGGCSALGKAKTIQNYFGTGETSGAELYARGLNQAASVGAIIKNTSAQFAENTGNSFRVATGLGDVYSKKLVVATGAARRRPDIPGLVELEGRGVSYCAVCDAFFYRKKTVGVLGAGSHAEHELGALKPVVGSVMLFTNGEEPEFETDCTVERRRIAQLVGVDRLTGVELEDGTVVKTDGLFVAIGTLGSVGIAKSMGVLADDKGIAVDARGMTNVRGLYAAGDCTPGIKQVAKAVFDGMTVGMSVIADLKAERA